VEVDEDGMNENMIYDICNVYVDCRVMNNASDVADIDDDSDERQWQ
jgi:hypothetical protein